MRTQLFNVGDGVTFYGEQATVEEVDFREGNRGWAQPDYFIRFVSGMGHTWANQTELEPVELNYESE